MRKAALGLLLLLNASCKGDKNPGKSPYFEDRDILTISGQFLGRDQQGLAATNIALRNLRVFAYVNPSQTYFKETLNWFLSLAFPMFPGYDTRPVKVKPNYFLKDARTDFDGSFSFKIQADEMLRDAQGGINIALINDGEGPDASYAKYNFVIKAQETTLEPIALCDLGESVQETALTLDWTWSAPSYALDHYEVRIADAQDNSLLWASRVEAGSQQLSLPKSIFQAANLRYAIEVFYRFEDEFHASCLTPSRTFTIADPMKNLAFQKKARAENIDFVVTSLTNGRFNDVSYFSAYDTQSMTVELGEDTVISSINLHNLQFTAESLTPQLTLEAATKAAPGTFVSIGLDAETPLRFGNYQLATPGSYARIRLRTSEVLATLQEITVQ